MDDATKKRSFDPHISLLSRTGGLDAHFLNGKLLHRFAERCAGYDRDNRFFHEDFEDLRQAGYLTMPVPTELGGA